MKTEIGGTFGDLTVGYYAILPAKVRHAKELSSSEKLLFAEVTALSQKWGYCTASNGFLGELLGVSNRTVTRQLANLRKLGFIRVELVRIGKEVEERRVYPLMDMYGKTLSDREVEVIVHKFNDKGEYLGTSTGGGVDKNDGTPTDINVHTPHDKNVYTPTDINVQSINTSINNTSINNIDIVADKSDDTTAVEKDDKPTIKKVIEYLNKVTGKQYNHKAASNQRMVRARINEGYTMSDFIAVIDYKHKEWSGDEAMSKYVRPATLFSGKFDGYLNQARFEETKSVSDTIESPKNKGFGDLYDF